MSTPDEIAELIIHLGRAARAEEAAPQLTPAQWTALRFLARANTPSRTPSAFATFHATTRGTATQTLKALETKGLIHRCAHERDARSVCYNLTEAGQAMLCQDPLRDLSGAIAGLAPDVQAVLGRALPQLVSALARRREVPSFGSCRDCRHHQPCQDDAPFCLCLAKGLAITEVNLLCVNFNEREDAPPDLRGPAIPR